jgi:hypothetical protein
MLVQHSTFGHLTITNSKVLNKLSKTPLSKGGVFDNSIDCFFGLNQYNSGVNKST